MGADHSGRIVDPGLAFDDPRLARLAALWLERAGAGGIPERSALGPEVLHPLGLLPNVMLVDVIDGGARFRYRLVGTEITAIAGRDATGKFFEEIYEPPALKHRTETLHWVMRERRPLRTADRLDAPGKEFIGYEALSAPLGNADGDIALIMVVMVRATPPARDAGAGS
jgi:hypothetical protein